MNTLATFEVMIASSNSPHIYLVPGLGADGRLFNRIRWAQGLVVTPLKWTEPLPNEAIADYAGKMCSGINQAEPFILIGVSLGGIMAIEMAKHIRPEKIIIISSIKNKREKPFYFVPGRFISFSIWPSVNHKLLFRILVRIFFGKIPKKQMEIFRDMLDKTSRSFLKWAQKTIAQWDNEQAFDNLWHIHGTSDVVFPAIFLKNYIPIRGGNHYMIISRAPEISRLLHRIIFDEAGTTS